MKYIVVFICSAFLFGCSGDLEYIVDGKYEGMDFDIKGVESASNTKKINLFYMDGEYNDLPFYEKVEALKPCPVEMKIRANRGTLSFTIEDHLIPDYPKSVTQKCALDYAAAIEKVFRDKYIKKKASVESYK